MPTQRKNERYYVKRSFPGIGQIYRSLHTDRLGIARRREEALLSLHRQGHHDVLRAFLEGRVSIQAIQEAHETGRVPDLEADLRRGSATLADACEAFLAHHRPSVKVSTWKRYRCSLNHLRAFHGDGANVAAVLSADAVQKFRGHRLDLGRARETVNNDIIAVSALCTYAVTKGWVDERPERAFKQFDYEARDRWIDGNELDLYLTALRPAFKVQMMLLVGTGMRLGESEGLRVCDLRLGEGRVVIRRSKTSAGVRNVFVPPWVAEALTGHIAEHSLSGADRLFPIARRTVRGEHNRACKLAGIPDYRIHDHRHTAAVQLARAGLPLDHLQKQLGHEKLDMTMRYANYHPDYTDVAEFFERAGDRLGCGSGNRTGNTPSEASAEKVASATA